MVYGNPPLLSAPVERRDECARITGTTDANDGVSEIHGANCFEDSLTLPDYARFPWGDMEGTSSSYPPEYGNTNSRFGGNIGSNFSVDPKNDANVIGAKIKVSEFPRESDTLYPEMTMRVHCNETDGNNHVTANHLSNTIFLSKDYHESEVQMKSMPVRGYAAEYYPIKAHGAEAKNEGPSRPQMNRNFSPSGRSASTLSRADNFLHQDVALHGSSGKVDGSFLALGIGGSTEIRRNSNFSTREIASKLEEAAPSQPHSSYARQKLNNPLRLAGPSYVTRAQRNVGEVPSSHNNMVSRISTSAKSGIVLDTARINPISLHTFRTSQADEQTRFLQTSDNFQFDRIPSSISFGNNSISYPERLNSSLSGLEPVNPAYFANQSNFNHQQNLYGQHGKSSMNVLAESSANSLYDRHRGRPIVHPRLENLVPPTEAIVNEFLPRSFQSVGQLYPRHNASSAEAHGISLFPERFSFPVPEGNTYQTAVAIPFPKRLGVQPNDFAPAQSARGPAPFHLSAHANPFRPFLSTDQHQHGIPARVPTAPQVDYSNGQVRRLEKLNIGPQASPKLYRPSLKRGATQLSHITPLRQRRRIAPQPLLYHSNPHQIQGVRAPVPSTAHITAAPLHIKWQGFDELPLPIGQKCLLCKRDLSFTAEGPVYQPTIPPAVAVLPCAHTFHDQCLQRITPADQSKNPPCIPCAMSET